MVEVRLVEKEKRIYSKNAANYLYAKGIDPIEIKTDEIKNKVVYWIFPESEEVQQELSNWRFNEKFLRHYVNCYKKLNEDIERVRGQSE